MMGSPAGLRRLLLLAGGFVAAVLSLGVFAELGEAVLWEGGLAGTDVAILQTLHDRLASPGTDRFMLVITWFGSNQAFLVLCPLVFAWLWASGSRQEAILLVLCLAGAGLLNAVFKEFFQRARPEPSLLGFLPPATAQGFSFPSGHAMVSFIFYGYLAYLYRRLVGRHWLLVGVGTALLVLVIGLSRIYLAVHWPSDVVAGYAAGLAYLVGCVAATERVGRRRRPEMEGGW